MNLLKNIAGILLFSLLAACGGGGGSAGTPVLGGGGGGTPAVAASDLVLALGASTIANDGSQTIVATATALDANRNSLAGIPVQFSVDANAVITPAGQATGGSGQVTATVGIGSDGSARTITVTARSGTLVRTATLVVSPVNVTAAASDLILSLSSATIANNGTQTVTATVTALDARRNTLPGVAVSVSVDQNAVATPSSTVTGANGTLSVALGIGSDRTNRTITVTATSGSLTRKAQLTVTDTVTGTAVASDLSLTLSAASLTNSGTATLRATATAVDANRNVVAGIPITFSVDNSAIAQVSGAVSGADGKVTADIGIGADRSNRLVMVTATSGALTRTASFRVVGADLTASFSPLVDTASTNNRIEYRLVDSNSSPMAGQAISVSAPGLPSASGFTDFNGKFTYTFTAPSSAGSVSLTAVSAGDTEVSAIQVQVAGGSTVPAAQVDPQSVSIAANPSVVSVNALGSTANQSEVRVLFMGANNAPVPNMRVRFDLAGNSSSTDGRVSWLGGTYAYSDANGVARATFTPGQRSSPTDGVTVRACYAKTDFAPDQCPASTGVLSGSGNVSTTLTVANEALSVSIGTNQFLKVGAQNLTYIKEYVVLVVDAAGQAKADVLISPSVDLTGYGKGFWRVEGAGTEKRWVQIATLAASESYLWAGSAWTRAVPAQSPLCPNEDVNRNGVREAGDASTPAPDISLRREDLNWNGTLDPRKADVAIKMVGSARTDANGLAVVQIEYPKSVGSWVDFLISVTATGIAGSEGRARYSGLLPVLADDVNNEDVPPAFIVSPYGTGSVCTDNL